MHEQAKAPEWVEPVPLPTVREVVEAHGHFVARSLRYLGLRDSDVLDASQDVFLVVHRRLEDFEGRSSIKTWLYGICLRVAASYKRRGFVRHESVMPEPPESATAALQDSDMQVLETRRKLLAILDHLAPDQRAVFVLYEIERLSMKEIAETLGCPLQTAYYRHQAARKQVMEAFQEGELKGEQ